MKKSILIPFIVTSFSLAACHDPEPKSISFGYDDLTLSVGATKQLEVIIEPNEQYDDLVITYSSSNSEIATVTNEGLLTALKEGESTIKASIGNYNIEASFLLHVYDKYPSNYKFVTKEDEHHYDNSSLKQFPTFTHNASEVDEDRGVYRYSPEMVYQLREDGKSYRVLGLDLSHYDNNNAYISPTYNGKPVVEIAERAFADKWYVFNVYIPSSIQIIRNAAFANSGIKNLYYDAEEIVDFPGSNWIFYPQNPDEYPASQMQQNIHLLVGPHAKCIPSRFFHPVGIYPQIKPTVASVEFAEGSQLKSIGEYAFYDIESIQSLRLPNTIEDIGDYAFYNTGIKELYLPDSLRQIGEYAFMFNDSLKNLRVSNNLEYIGESAFSGCSSLEYLSFASSKLKEIGKYAFKNIDKLAYLDLGNVEIINDSAFENCSSLKDLYINDKVLELNYSAFKGCTGVENLYLGSGIASIANEAFSNLENVKKLYVNNDNISELEAGNKVFYRLGKNNQEGIEVIYYEGVTSTTSRMFFPNSDVESFIKIKTLYLPKSLTAIASYTFYGANIEEIRYAGNKNEYEQISMGDHNDLSTPIYLGGK